MLNNAVGIVWKAVYGATLRVGYLEYMIGRGVECSVGKRLMEPLQVLVAVGKETHNTGARAFAASGAFLGKVEVCRRYYIAI
jgi:hypothetical protein